MRFLSLVRLAIFLQIINFFYLYFNKKSLEKNNAIVNKYTKKIGNFKVAKKNLKLKLCLFSCI
jgi:hypothetical protein